MVHCCERVGTVPFSLDLKAIFKDLATLGSKDHGQPINSSTYASVSLRKMLENYHKVCGQYFP